MPGPPDAESRQVIHDCRREKIASRKRIAGRAEPGRKCLVALRAHLLATVGSLIGGRIDDKDRAARAQAPECLTQRTLVIRRILKGRVVNRYIELVVFER